MSEIMVNAFGRYYLKGGRISIKFFGGGVQNGDKIMVKGIVTEKEKEADSIRVDCDIWMEKNEGRKVVAGTASALLPV